jgi:hypothetical protein
LKIYLLIPILNEEDTLYVPFCLLLFYLDSFWEGGDVVYCLLSAPEATYGGDVKWVGHDGCAKEVANICYGIIGWVMVVAISS